MSYRCGYVGIFGRPNTGKSTFLNRVLGQKVSIVSHRPQTTRNRVVGIHTTDEVQAILVDTPGHHDAHGELNRRIVKAAEAALDDVDVVLLLADLTRGVHQARAERAILSKGEEILFERIAERGKPVVLGLNKVDAVDKEWVLPVIDAWSQVGTFEAVVPFSALKGKGHLDVLAACTSRLPEGPRLFDEDQLMDNSERFVVAELVREKLFHTLRDELPYQTAVEVESFVEDERGGQPFVTIGCRILVERSSQKGIVIGKRGATIKKIGSTARRDIERLLACRVHLELFVAVEPNWSRNPRKLQALGYEG